MTARSPCPLISPRAVRVLTHPLAFVLRLLAAFGKNQGLLLAGAIAYYVLLSVVPLLILCVIALSHLVDQGELLYMLGRSLEWLVPSQSQAVLADVSTFLANRVAISLVLVATMLFFSAIAFRVLEKAMAIIFFHRGGGAHRHFMVSAVLPYCFVFSLGIALLGVTFATTALQAMAEETLQLFGHTWSLRGLAGGLFYLLGVSMEALFLTALYLVLPVGRTHLLHALFAGVAVMAAWEVVRHFLVWYYTSLSTASVVYGSLTTAVVALFSIEIVATLFLLGAQAIAEYEHGGPPADAALVPPGFPSVTP